MPFRLPCLIACLLLCAGCASVPPADATTTFVVVRHAEKADDDPRDPSLSGAGQRRAEQLAQRLQGDDVVAVYATDYRRTRQTAQPTAGMHALAVTTYDARLPAAEFAARLKASHAHGTVLVVGHSNTVPEIVAALCDCETVPMPDTEYDRIGTVRIDADGRTRLDTDRYGSAP